MALNQDIINLIGKTPILMMRGFCAKNGLNASVFGKLEYYNPTQSVKDRTAAGIILSAEQNGELKEGAEIVEATSGNTGISLACIAAARGYRLTVFMPENMSVERQKMIRAYGAQVVLTPKEQAMEGAVRLAEIAASKTGAFMARQFENEANPNYHYKTTGAEIWDALGNKIDYLVAGVGTGGTITGAGKYLKERKADIKIIAVEPKSSAVLSGEKSGFHKIQGIGAGFIPAVLDTGIYNKVIKVSDEAAFESMKQAAQCDGAFVGISSGAVLAACKELAQNEAQGKTILAILPDSGNRYLSII